jgi:hypothetical protein
LFRGTEVDHGLGFAPADVDAGDQAGGIVDPDRRLLITVGFYGSASPWKWKRPAVR